jgi:hypothetical protein
MLKSENDSQPELNFFMIFLKAAFIVAMVIAFASKS